VMKEKNGRKQTTPGQGKITNDPAIRRKGERKEYQIKKGRQKPEKFWGQALEGEFRIKTSIGAGKGR